MIVVVVSSEELARLGSPILVGVATAWLGRWRNGPDSRVHGMCSESVFNSD